MGMSSRTRLGSLVGLFAATAVLIAGCGSNSSSKSSSAAAATPASAGTSGSGGGVAIRTTKGSVGTYLVSASGRPIYMWVADTGGRSNCSGQCAKFWPPLLTKATPTVSGGASASDIALITRSDGSKQVTYKGHPLYYFLEDRGAGTLHGQGNNGFGAKWWLLAPSGTAITAKISSGAPAKASGGSSGGGNGGGSGGYGGGGYGY